MSGFGITPCVPKASFPEVEPSEVSVIVVSFNTKEYLRACLAAIEPRHEIIVVDNASIDGSPQMVATEFPRVHLIENRVNRGFGAANNQGIDVMTRSLALLLNSDARPEPGAIDALAILFRDQGVVATGGGLLNEDNSRQNSCCNRLTLWAVACEQLYLEKIFPQSSFFSPYWITHRLPADRVSAVFQVMGACLMLRPVARFDERFFLYCEDTELCLRLRPHGTILYSPGAHFYHALGASSSGTRWESVARYNRGKELYFAIHHGLGQALVCRGLDRLGAGLRLLFWSLRSLIPAGNQANNRAQRILFWSVLTAPRDGPPRPPDTD